MATPETDISIQALFSRSLTSASKASILPTADNETQVWPHDSMTVFCIMLSLHLQDLVGSALKDLRLLTGRISHLHLFSPNETLEDVSSGDLIYMSVPFIFGEVELNVRAPKPEERSLHLRQAEVCFLLVSRWSQT